MESLKKMGWKLISCICLLFFLIILGLHIPNPVYSQTDNEPNDDYSTASPLVLNGRNTGQLDYSLDRVDFWTFTIDKDGELTKIAAIFDASLTFYLWIYDSDGATVLYNQIYSGSSPHVFGPFGLKAGTYYVKLQAYSSKTGKYTLDTYYADQPWDNDVEPNVNALEAKPMNANGVTTGHLGYRGGDPVIDTQDWWSITSDIAREIKLSMIFDTSLAFYLWIYDSDGATVLYNQIYSGTSGQKVFGPFNFIAGKTYYVKLQIYSDKYGGYRFDTGSPTTTTINPTTTTSIISTTTTTQTTTSTTSIVSTTTTTQTTTSTTSIVSTTTIKPNTTTTIPSQASCGTVTPSAGKVGETKDITITGLNTHFGASTEVTLSCAIGITVNSLIVNSATQLIINITLANDAPAGKCDIGVQTGNETITCIDAFEILSRNTTTTIPGGLTVDFIGSPTVGSAPLSVKFANLSSGNISGYLWNFGDGSTSEELNPTHVFTKWGNFAVILTAYASDGTSKQAVKPNYVVVTPPCPFLSSLDNQQEIKIIRILRDSMLNNISGIILTSIYYKNYPEISLIMTENPELQDKLRELVAEHIGVACNLIASGEAKVSNSAANDAIEFLYQLREKSSIKLQNDIDLLIYGITKGFVLEGLGVNIE